MTNEQLTADLLDKADRFNNSGIELSEDTIVGDVIKVDDGPEGAKAPEVFQNVIKWDINNNGTEVKEWPIDWLSITFKQLASSLLIFLFMFLSFKPQAQVNINFSAVKTQLKQGAIAIGVSYLKNLDNRIGGTKKLVYGKNSVFSFSPSFDFLTGTNDAMSSITAKFTALNVIFKTKELKGLVVADLSKTFTTVPISVGVETNGVFGFINGLAEVGYAPWWGGYFGKHITTAVYLQTGYKFRIDDAVGIGGAEDQSEEAVNDGLFRVKGYISADSKVIVRIKDIRAGLIGKATGWIDVANDATYYRLDGILRIYLTENNSLDVAIQKGSGAPNFNQGTQYSGGLTIRF